jgi:DNA primase
MSTIDEIKQKADIVEIIGRYTKLSRSGKTLKGLCPFHTEKHGSFFVYPEQQTWHCFGACGTGGDVFSFIMRKEGCDFTEAKKILAEQLGVPIRRESLQEQEEKGKRERLFLTNEAACEYYHRLLIDYPGAKKARDYLLDRGLNSESVEKFRLGYATTDRDSLKEYLLGRGFTEEEAFSAGLLSNSRDLFQNRLLFPIGDARGRITGFGGRALDNSIPKYLNTPQTPVFNKKEILYGFDLIKKGAEIEEIVIVEGYLDVIIAHQYGFGNVVASMGTAISDFHAALLRKLKRQVILALDSDTAGEEAMVRCSVIENMLDSEIKVALLPPGKDPDVIVLDNPQAWTKLISTAAPLLDFIFDSATSKLDLRAASGKQAAAEALLPIVIAIEDAVRRAHYLNRLSGLVGVRASELLHLQRKKQIKSVPGILPGGTGLAISNIEEYFLTLLLKCPEIKNSYKNMPADYFASSENREIFRAACNCQDEQQLEHELDDALWERCRFFLKAEVFTTEMEYRLSNLELRLKEEYYRRLAEIKEEIIEPEDAEAIRRIFLEKEKLGLKRRKK